MKNLTYNDIKFAEDERYCKLKDIPFGMVFKRDETSHQVYIKTNYVRWEGINKYSCILYDDMNKEIFMKGDKVVFVGFEY